MLHHTASLHSGIHSLDEPSPVEHAPATAIESEPSAGGSYSTNPTTTGSVDHSVLDGDKMTAEPESMPGTDPEKETGPPPARSHLAFRQKSAISVSDLQVPGTFPKGSV
jgi:hypothetical protein